MSSNKYLPPSSSNRNKNKKCKYCKKNGHTIDECQEIICKKCRKVGHPYWNCAKYNKTNPINTTNKLKEFISKGIKSGHIIKVNTKENDPLMISENMYSMLHENAGDDEYDNGWRSSTSVSDNNKPEIRIKSLKNIKIKNEEVIQSGDENDGGISINYYWKFNNCRWGDLL